MDRLSGAAKLSPVFIRIQTTDSAENVGVSRPSEALPKAARADGSPEGGAGPLSNPRFRRAFYAASTLSASVRLASMTCLAMRASSDSGLAAPAGSSARFSS